MPRPKGSKNKTSKKAAVPAVNMDETIAALDAEVKQLSADLKAKKAELKKLVKAKKTQEEKLAAKQAEENKAAILAAVEKSGKSLDEVLELLNR